MNGKPLSHIAVDMSPEAVVRMEQLGDHLQAQSVMRDFEYLFFTSKHSSNGNQVLMTKDCHIILI